MGPCVSADTLARRLAGGLAEAELAAVDEHIEGCSGCQDQLERLLDDGPGVDWRSVLAEEDGCPDIPGFLLRLARRNPCSVAEDASSAAPSEGATGPLGDRFRVLEFHAEGALGEVFLARDEELCRKVALKRIKQEHADDPQCRARFMVEAEITGYLEHPGIVPVYGRGRDVDGRLFYAMRFVRGETLKDAIARFHSADTPDRDHGERSLVLRQLLGRFVDVCEAVDFAHSRGVIHRDLKPSNILLGPHGETLVVDWGLAKSVGRPDTAKHDAERTFTPESGGAVQATHVGVPIGTPAFMSPEQADGRPDAVGMASDIYSLGATLYALLTGRGPIAGQGVFELLQNVKRGDFPPPRTMNPRVDRGLDAICRKAMALKPTDRYRTARLLADDIECWLADQPLAALPETLARRAGRWQRRHRTLVMSMMVVLVIGLAGVAGFAAVLAAKNRTLDRQRHRAEERETLAIRAVKKFRDVVMKNPELKNRPELEPLRKSLLDQSINFVLELRDQLEAEPDTRPEALDRFARIAFELATTSAELGSIPDAVRACSEAVAIYESLARRYPTDPRFQHWLASTHRILGTYLQTRSRRAEALASYHKALEVQRNLVRDHADEGHFLVDLATTLVDVGVLHAEQGDTKEALEWFRQAKEIHDRLDRRDVAFGASWDLPEYGPVGRTVNIARSEHARTLSNLGPLLAQTGRRDEALKGNQQAEEILERLVHDVPDVPWYKDSLAGLHGNIGQLRSAQGDEVGALEDYRRMLEICENLIKDYPTTTAYQWTLALSYFRIGGSWMILTQWPEASESFGSAVAVLEKLADDNPSVPPFRLYLASSHYAIGRALLEMRKPDEEAKTTSRSQGRRNALAYSFSSLSKNLFDVGVADD